MSAVDDETVPTSGRSRSSLSVETKYLDALDKLRLARRELADITAARATLGDVGKFDGRYGQIGQAVDGLANLLRQRQTTVRAAESNVGEAARAWRSWLDHEPIEAHAAGSLMGVPA